jgi:hypothetical protein
MYHAPVLRELARFVEQRLFARVEADRLERELRELDSLSDEEIAALLADEPADGSPWKDTGPVTAATARGKGYSG